MRFTPTPLAGAWILDVEPIEDGRGFFARSWCRREMEEHGLSGALVQCSVSFNRAAGTLRGMHYQAPPHEETKVVRCTRGAVHDVIVDLRPASPTFRRWFASELSDENHRALYVPAGFAHGFQTLRADTEVLYQMSEFHREESARGVRWDDPAFAIEWPSAPSRTMSERDRSYPDFLGGSARA
jgi:dTDP-4-dehydrorhamnose 3,5-epimerase